MAASYKADGPVTLSEEQILILHQKLRDLRHEVNGKLGIMVLAAELMRMRPEAAAERLKLLMDQPVAVKKIFWDYSQEFEKALGIVKD